MLNNNILVLGKGHLGSYLARKWNIRSEFHWRTELSDLTPDFLQKLRPRAIVNTVGKTDLRWCEENAREAYRCNVEVPLALFRIASHSSVKIPLIHISSGCVWDGPYNALGKPFTVEQTVTPQAFYSWTKVSADTLLINEACRSEYGALAILRPRQVYSDSPANRNTLSKLRTYKELIDTPNSMTSADTIARTIETIIEYKKYGYNGKWIYNVYDKGITSPFKVGQLLAEAKVREKPILMEKDFLDTILRPKRVDTVLYDYDFEYLVEPPNVEDELKRVIGHYAEFFLPHHP